MSAATAVVVHDLTSGTVDTVGVTHVVHGTTGNSGINAELARVGATHEPGCAIPINWETAQEFPNLYALATGERVWPEHLVTTFGSISLFVNSGVAVARCFECEVGR